MAKSPKPKRKTPSQPPSEDREKIEESQFKALFHELFTGALYEHINPFACIPIVNLRNLSESGIRRLTALFRAGYEQADGFCSVGLMHGTDTPIVVELKGPLFNLLVHHFKAKDLNDDELQHEISKHPQWYGIIDGSHSNEAVRRLSKTEPSWKNVTWFVTVLKGVHSEEKYRQLSRAQNSRHSERYYVEITLSDVLKNLRLEHDQLLQYQQKPTHINVAKRYFGAPTVSRTETFLASLAVRLQRKTLDALHSIMNEECPSLCVSHSDCDNFGVTDRDKVMEVLDCRLFKRFLSLHSMRMSTAFMNPKNILEEEAQWLALYRARDFSA